MNHSSAFLMLLFTKHFDPKNINMYSICISFIRITGHCIFCFLSKATFFTFCLLSKWPQSSAPHSCPSHSSLLCCHFAQTSNFYSSARLLIPWLCSHPAVHRCASCKKAHFINAAMPAFSFLFIFNFFFGSSSKLLCTLGSNLHNPWKFIFLLKKHKKNLSNIKKKNGS